MKITLKLAAGFAVAALLAAMLGPFQGAEQELGLSDTAAHAIGFAIITASISLLMPKLGLWRTALAALALGLAVEGVQGLTGRSASLSDLAADAVGIAVITVLRRLLAARSPKSLRDRRA